MEFAGEFETHLTVRLDPALEIETLRAWASRHGLKCLQIVLDKGTTPIQPMLTRRARGRLTDELAVAHALAGDLHADGFPVCRIKLEVAPHNDDVPQTDAEALRHPAFRYFEHHVKVDLAADTDVASLTDLARSHSAHLSRNALRVRDDGLAERFVTQRCVGEGRVAAGKSLLRLVDALRFAGYRILDVEEEYVVYDSNLALDAGWLETRS